MKKAYLAYFEVKVGDQDKNWGPHQVYRTYVENLRQWTKQKRKTIGFAVPMVWREQENHVDDCYFCMTNVAGFSSKSKGSIKYPYLLSAIRPIPHSADLPPPLFTSLPELVDEPVSSTSEESFLEDNCYEPLADNKSPILITQAFLNDLVRDLNLPKESAELLGSRLQHNNLLAPNTTYSWYRQREKDLVQYFFMEEIFVYCHNVAGLLQAMACIYVPTEWRLFIDSSKASLKCVLLHNGNRYASIPIGHCVHLKETYENMKLLLTKIKYNERKWMLCGDLKVLIMLLSQQGGIPKPMLFVFMG